MKPFLLPLTTVAACLSLGLPLQAAEVSPPIVPAPTAQGTLDRRDVLEACVQNRAETLPNPFIDVSPDHWAYKAVLTMYYCGPFRQATPRSLIDRLSAPDTPQSQQPQSSQG